MANAFTLVLVNTTICTVYHFYPSPLSNSTPGSYGPNAGIQETIQQHQRNKLTQGRGATISSPRTWLTADVYTPIKGFVSSG